MINVGCMVGWVGMLGRGSGLYIFQRDVLMESDLWQERISHNHRMGIRRIHLLLALPFSVLMSWHNQ